MLSIYLCKGTETVNQAIKAINEQDPAGRKFEVDEAADSCIIGDERFTSAPWIINCRNRYWAVREKQ